MAARVVCPPSKVEVTSFCSSSRRRGSSACRGVRCCSESCVPECAGLFGFDRPRLDLAVSDGPCGSSPEPSSATLPQRNHPLVSFALLHRLFDCHCPAVHARRLPWGLVPLRDLEDRSPLPMGVPRPT